VPKAVANCLGFQPLRNLKFTRIARVTRVAGKQAIWLSMPGISIARFSCGEGWMNQNAAMQLRVLHSADALPYPAHVHERIGDLPSNEKIS
jgi:hypothetical protein